MDGKANTSDMNPDERETPKRQVEPSFLLLAIAFGIVGAVLGAPKGMQVGLEAGEHPPLGSLCLGFMLGGFGGATIGALLGYVMENPAIFARAFRNVTRNRLIIVIALMIVSAGLAWVFLPSPANKRHLLLQYRVGIRDFSKARLRRASLVGVDLSEAILDETDLTKAILSGANLRDASLIGVHFGGSILFEANLTGTDLRGADLTGTDLRGAKLTGANLGGVDLIEADLRGADLQGSDMNNANLYDAIYNDSTRWPRDFEAEQSDAVMASRVSLVFM